jgi:hypothetical protein
MKERISKQLGVGHLHAFRNWERKNLPHYGKEAGYFLFLELAHGGGANQEALKEFYLSMPYSESTMRLLFRNLENDGWLEMPRRDEDRRIKNFVLTDKFHRKTEEWLEVADSIFRSENGAANDLA